MKRIALLVAALAACSTQAALTARSYVQKGLVACYDGIDNAGTGAHDATAATWADLSGNGFDGTLAANRGWAADGWTNAVDGSGVRVGTRLMDALSLGAFTVRFACVPARDNVRQSFFSDYVNGDGALAIEHNDGYTSDGSVRLFLEGTPRYSVLAPVVIPKDTFSSVSVSATSTEQIYWRNGSTAWTNEAAFGSVAAGRIRAGSAAPARSVSGWYNQDGLDIVVLTAVPYQYYVFAGWTGDTDAIADGSADSPAVRVDTTRPVSLVANFVSGNIPPTVILVK